MSQYIISNEQVMDRCLQEIMALPMKPLHEVTIKRTNRSNQQNRYYWGVVLDQISKATGYLPKELDDMQRKLHLVGRKTKSSVKSEQVSALLNFLSLARELIIEEFRYTNKEAHELFKASMLAESLKNMQSGDLIDYPSTSQLSTKGMAEYMNKVIEFGLGNGIHIPTASERGFYINA